MSKVDRMKNFKEVPLPKLVMAEWNYKKNNEELQKKLVANIKRSGQIENILVRQLGKGQYEVVNGNHRFTALQELGHETAVVYDLGKISLAAAKRIAVETNETKFESDNIQLAQLLRDITQEFDDVEATLPFSDNELDSFNSLLDFDWDADEVDTDDDDNKGDSKSETLISAGGEKFKTVKLEISHKLADLLEAQMDRFRDDQESVEKPLELILSYVAKAKDVDVMGPPKQKPTRKAAKKSRKKNRRRVK